MTGEIEQVQFGGGGEGQIDFIQMVAMQTMTMALETKWVPSEAKM